MRDFSMSVRIQIKPREKEEYILDFFPLFLVFVPPGKIPDPSNTRNSAAGDQDVP